jgi:predicted O-methyltransferase YrrM
MWTGSWHAERDREYPSYADTTDRTPRFGDSAPHRTKVVRVVTRESRLPFGPKGSFVPADPASPDYPRQVVDYYCQPFLIDDRQVMQVYEELLHLAYWLRGFRPRNVLEIGTVGATFFVLSQLSTGKKACVDIRDIRHRIHGFMFGHEWQFFQGDSHSESTRDAIASYCGAYDVIFIDGDHRYEGVARDFEMYRELLSERGVIMFHDVDPDHVFKDKEAGGVHRFWQELSEGTKTMLRTDRSSGRVRFMGEPAHFGGIGIWSPG